MLFSVIKQGVFQDSVSLMLLTKKIAGLPEVGRISIMMGTPANKEIFANTGFLTEEINNAKPADLCIAIEADSADVIDIVVKEVEAFLNDQSVKRKGSQLLQTKTFDGALKRLPDANLALISIAGKYAAREATKALEAGLNVFLFSDNVSVEQEIALKQNAHEKGLIVMGPDCGTGTISGVPLAFSNVNIPGGIGIVGASGTGTQAVLAGIDALDSGISHAIGIGGRDLSEQVGGRSALDAINFLVGDPKTEVIVFISKPPAKAVRDRIIAALEEQKKPAVAIFLGEKASPAKNGVWYAGSLGEAAKLAVEIYQKVQEQKARAEFKPEQKQIRGLFCGGTLASEAAFVLADGLNAAADAEHKEGVMFASNGNSVIDLGDDAYTVGRAHPMIDPTLRSEMIEQAALDPKVAVILFDLVIGYGAHADPASIALEAINKAKEKRPASAGKLVFIASICGTKGDPQGLDDQINKLKTAGVWCVTSNKYAAEIAVRLLHPAEDTSVYTPVHGGVCAELLQEKPRIINIGLTSFADDLVKNKIQTVQVNWAPPAGGDDRLLAALDRLK